MFWFGFMIKHHHLTNARLDLMHHLKEGFVTTKVYSVPRSLTGETETSNDSTEKLGLRINVFLMLDPLEVVSRKVTDLLNLQDFFFCCIFYYW